MTLQFNKDLPSFKSLCVRSLILPHELHEALPLPFDRHDTVSSSRQIIKNILSGIDPRLLLIIGPCSIHDIDSTLEYANRLKELSQSISDSFFVVMRVYFEKPRSAGGWKGFALDPHLDGSHEISKGHYLTRQLLVHLAELGLPAGAEFLEPTSGHYFGDLISWGCIGARTSESQLHRQMASGFNMPIAFKNNTCGNIEVAVNGIHSASQPHTFMTINREGQLAVTHSDGNPDCHLVLRGGREKPNYDACSIATAVSYLEEAKLSRSLLIDCSHDNSSRICENQPLVFRSVIEQVQAGNKQIKGICLESHLNHGKQPLPKSREDLEYGISVTDSCLGWEATRELIVWGHKVIKNVLLNSLSLSLVLLLFFCFSLSSCRSHSRLSVSSEYITQEHLASYIVGTPDPALNKPPVGQRVLLRWNLPDFFCQKLTCKLYLRFRDRTEAVETINFPNYYGIHVYSLLNEQYFARQGILSYKVEVFADGELVEECRHHMWVELITFDE